MPGGTSVSATPDFLAELGRSHLGQGLSSNEVIAFVRRLSNNPYEPDLIREAEVNGDIFAFRLSGGYVIYWTVDLLDDSPSISDPKMQVKILALKPG